MTDASESRTPQRANIGMVFDRTFPPGELSDYVRRVDDAGLDELWIIEDCFFTAGVSLAASALARSDRLGVGIGIVPAVARNPAVTAMEFATLANLAPGRFVGGIGHGVQEWMGQMGARPASPLTVLEETIDNVKRLLRGDNVTFDGRHVHLESVALDQPPAVMPPIVAGVQQQKSLALAGRVADGVILVEGVGPTYTRWSLEHAAPEGAFSVTTFTMLSIESSRREAYGNVAPFVAGMFTDRRPAVRVLPFFDEVRQRIEAEGSAALLDMPADYWLEIGAIGTADDALAHVEALEAAGASSINIFPTDQLDVAHHLIPLAGQLVAR